MQAHPLRLLRKNPVLSLAAIVSLALGIGANTTVFSYANALFFSLPPVHEPHRLVEVWTIDPTPGASLNGHYPLSYPDYQDFVAQTKSLSGVVVYDPGVEVNMVRDGQSAAQTGQLVSANYFSLLGVEPMGRGFLPSEGATKGQGAVMVLSHQVWTDRFGADPRVIGQTVELNGVPFTIVGVAPAGFTGMFGGIQVDFWAPLMMADRLGDAATVSSRSNRSLFAVGRLNPGVTVAQASTEMNLIQHRIDQAHPGEDPSEFGGAAADIGMLPTPFRGFVGAGAGLLAVVVGLVLLIACVNAALVLLVQAMGRRREWAIRQACGASRWQLVRQGLGESLVLALIAGGLGVGLARALGPLLLRLAPPGFPITLDLSVNGHVLLFSLGIALLTGILFGLAPAWQSASFSVLAGLKDGTPGSGAGRSLARSLFVVAEVALCVVVLVGATLCLRSLANARAISPGFDSQHLITAAMDPGALGYSGPAATQFLHRVHDTMRQVPGVLGVAYTDRPPLQLGASGTEVLAPGMVPPPKKDGYDVDKADVTPGYFQASGTRLLQGRDFQPSDLAPGRDEAVVINEALAEEFWPHQNAVGQTLLFPGAKPKKTLVVGVAETGKYRSLGEAPRPFVYELQDLNSAATLIVRVSGSPRALLPTIQRDLQGLDPNLTSDAIETIQEYLAVPLFPARFSGILLGGFGLLALALAMLGLYGVIASSVAQRTREFGIRMALGADGGAVTRLVVSQGVRLAVYGIVVGVVAAAAVTHFMAALLYGMSPLDPASYFLTAIVLAGMAALASFIPARRATRVDPLRALRWE
ncbi:MAG TPA: ABC transporter permease [Terriglobales bacterium]|nr:ABC transporter permease [Terriglobales bacterium]